MGGAQGGLARQGPRATSMYTTLQLRLKIALAFDAVFLCFWFHLGCQDGLQNLLKIMSSWVKLAQVGLKLGPFGLKLAQVGVSYTSLDVQVHKMWFPYALGTQPGPT